MLKLYKELNNEKTLEQRIAKLEAMLNKNKAMFVFIIHSTMTDNSWYFMSTNKSVLKNNMSEICDLFFESLEDEELYSDMLDLCKSNGIKCENDTEYSIITTYREYLDEEGIDPDYDEYDDSIDMNSLVYVDKDIYEVKVISKVNERF